MKKEQHTIKARNIMNSNDNDDDENDNIVEFKKPRQTNNTNKGNNNHQQQVINEPLINMPPFTKYLLGVLIAIQLIVTFILNNKQFEWIVFNLGFIPGRFSGDASFEPLAILTPFTSMFFHGGWLHLGINAVMLLAFGSGVERWMGGKKMCAFFIACGLIGSAFHFALNPHSVTPVIGASGGISGLFAAALVMLNKNNIGMTGRFGLWPIVIIWVAVSVIFGFIDTPQIGVGKGDIAWAAHVGGFLGGFAVLKIMRII